MQPTLGSTTDEALASNTSTPNAYARKTGHLKFNVRRAEINPNHWYVAALSSEVTRQPFSCIIWKQPIVLYRDSQGMVHGLDDYCPHRMVKLSHGAVVGDNIECAYHGWQFTGTGHCASVPYLATNQKLPSCKIRHYPVQELDGFIWIFPGNPSLAAHLSPLGIPEWNHLNHIGSVASFSCPGHFSYLIENLMDMHHGHLHQRYQAWASAALNSIEEFGDRVIAHYQAQSYYQINQAWSVLQLFIPFLRRLHPEPLDVSYIYPHWSARLGNDFKIYCLFCPEDETHTRAYLLHFTSLNSYTDLHRLPKWFRRFIKNRLFGTARWLLKGLISQDIQMIQDEQAFFLRHPNQRGYELNRTLVFVQRLISRQASLCQSPLDPAVNSMNSPQSE
jgi:phenylpropionate dioxygenase-like ring-hydroxylating dioxygenase large terminal subunit